MSAILRRDRATSGCHFVRHVSLEMQSRPRRTSPRVASCGRPSWSQMVPDTRSRITSSQSSGRRLLHQNGGMLGVMMLQCLVFVLMRARTTTTPSLSHDISRSCPAKSKSPTSLRLLLVDFLRFFHHHLHVITWRSDTAVMKRRG